MEKMTLGHRTTLGRELKAPNGKNDFGSQIKRTTLGCELKALNI